MRHVVRYGIARRINDIGLFQSDHPSRSANPMNEGRERGQLESAQLIRHNYPSNWLSSLSPRRRRCITVWSHSTRNYVLQQWALSSITSINKTTKPRIFNGSQQILQFKNVKNAARKILIFFFYQLYGLDSACLPTNTDWADLSQRW